jgi:hypothetical protein
MKKIISVAMYNNLFYLFIIFHEFLDYYLIFNNKQAINQSSNHAIAINIIILYV